MKIHWDEWIRRCEALWAMAQPLAQAIRPGCPIEEPFDLTIASLLYQRTALASFHPDQLHKLIREDRAASIMDCSLSSFLELGANRPEFVGRMDLASAAVRLPVAVLEIVEALEAGAQSSEPFGCLVARDTGYWREQELSKSASTTTLTCCGDGISLDLESSLDVVMLVRNGFGHGEKDKRSTSRRRTDREDRLNRTFRCRLIEAEQVLSEWILSKMSQALLP